MSKRARNNAGPAVFTVGRFNPPTSGHQNMIKNMINKFPGYKPYVLVSVKQNKKLRDPTKNKNPLAVNEKLNILKNLFPNVEFMEMKGGLTPATAVQKLRNMNHTNVAMVVGNDQLQPFSKFVKANQIVAGGTRGGQGATANVSSTRARCAAVSNDFNNFQKCMAKELNSNRIKNLARVIRNRYNP